MASAPTQDQRRGKSCLACPAGRSAARSSSRKCGGGGAACGATVSRCARSVAAARVSPGSRSDRRVRRRRGPAGVSPLNVAPEVRAHRVAEQRTESCLRCGKTWKAASRPSAAGSSSNGARLVPCRWCGDTRPASASPVRSSCVCTTCRDRPHDHDGVLRQSERGQHVEHPASASVRASIPSQTGFRTSERRPVGFSATPSASAAPRREFCRILSRRPTLTIASIAGFNSRPRSVRAYSTVGGEVGCSTRVKMPTPTN